MSAMRSARCFCWRRAVGLGADAGPFLEPVSDFFGFGFFPAVAMRIDP